MWEEILNAQRSTDLPVNEHSAPPDCLDQVNCQIENRLLMTHYFSWQRRAQIDAFRLKSRVTLYNNYTLLALVKH